MEPQNKHLKSIFFNFLLLLAFIFSIMGLYVSLSFSEKINGQSAEVIDDDSNLELQKLNNAISELEKKVLGQAENFKVIEGEWKEFKKNVTHSYSATAKKETVAVQESTQPSARFHIIQPGDTFSKVSKIYQVSLNALMKANNNLNPKALRVGQKIVIP